jgi:hypothetical protein
MLDSVSRFVLRLLGSEFIISSMRVAIERSSLMIS